MHQETSEIPQDSTSDLGCRYSEYRLQSFNKQTKEIIALNQTRRKVSRGILSCYHCILSPKTKILTRYEPEDVSRLVLRFDSQQQLHSPSRPR